MLALNFHHNGVFSIAALSLASIIQLAVHREFTGFVWPLLVGIGVLDWLRRMFREDKTLMVDVYHAYKILYAGYLVPDTEQAMIVVAITMGLDFVAAADELVGYSATTIARMCVVITAAVGAEVVNLQGGLSLPMLGCLAALLHPWVTATINGDLMRHVTEARRRANAPPPAGSSDEHHKD